MATMTSYGATELPASSPPTSEEATPPKQTFSISEPYSSPSDTLPLRGKGRRGGGICSCAMDDGLKIIVISMFVFAVAVTVALAIQIATGELK